MGLDSKKMEFQIPSKYWYTSVCLQPHQQLAAVAAQAHNYRYVRPAAAENYE